MKTLQELKEWSINKGFRELKYCHCERELKEKVSDMGVETEYILDFNEKELFTKGLDECNGYFEIEFNNAYKYELVKVYVRAYLESYSEESESFQEVALDILGCDF